MEKLIAELQRLYFLHDQQWFSQKIDDSGRFACLSEGLLSPQSVADSLAGGTGLALDLVGPDGLLRAMVVSFNRATEWEPAARLYQAVQNDLDLPAPAVSVSGQNGYELWFSLREPVPVAQARLFLAALRVRYLADIPAVDLGFCPDIDKPVFEGPALITLAPALNMSSGKWSAFIDPSMGGMFVDGPWLEMAPNRDKQADILSGYESIQAGDFQKALDLLQAPADADKAGPSPVEGAALRQDDALGQTGTDAGKKRASLNVGNTFSDPKSFLLAVMNDSSASASQRIKAAKALRPYFSSAASK